jgi:predicted helicase
MGQYAEFPNICFVDTLDNTVAMKYGKQTTMFGLSSENTERIKRQNEKKISVIIGNPPYNANQKNENENNKNREYPDIDNKIKSTFIKNSTAQKTKVYDMYARFYRWAMDRIDKNGIVALITNRSFIDSRTFDGFRKCIEDDFCKAYIIDTKSDVRANPKIAGTTHNVFGIQTGVAIMLLVKKENYEGKCEIEYVAMEDNWRKEEKLDWLKNNPIKKIEFMPITPDKNHNWINLTENDWEELIPIADKEVKSGRKKEAIFKLFSLGVVTARDEWVCDFNETNLSNKTNFFINLFNELINEKDLNFENDVIKWSEALKINFRKLKKIKFNSKLIIKSAYRPFVNLLYYAEKTFSDRLTNMHYQTFGKELSENNFLIGFVSGSRLDFATLASNILPNLAYYSLDPAIWLPLFRFDTQGNRIDNITDWGLEQFQTHYKNKRIIKEDIFYYVYGVLHNPAYRKKYELNLKREFPRILFYKDFRKWCNWGKDLMDLHLNYEDVKPAKLNVITSDSKSKQKEEVKRLIEEVKEPEQMYPYLPKIKVKLKADKEHGIIEIDELTTISGIPKEAFDYKLGNRSALEWILDQYKEKKPSDPTIAEKFNTYRFADYKEKVIDLLKRVTTVSVETMKIIKQIEEENE